MTPKFVAEISLGSVASICAVFAAAISVTMYVARIEAGQQVNSSRIDSIEDRMSRTEVAATEAKREQTARLDRIENKIDSLLRESRALRAQ
jgi:hypothetical protein